MISDKFNLGLTVKHSHVLANIFLRKAVVFNKPTPRSTCENKVKVLKLF